MKEQYYDLTIKTYNESGYENIPEKDFPHWESFLIPYLKDNSHILDLGCGSGIYSKRFKELGYQVTAVDAAANLCDYASKILAQDVRCLRFSELQDFNQYDAVFACVSLLHAPSEDYPDIFRRIYRALQDQGFLYLSFKEGEEEGYQEESELYFTEMTKNNMTDLLNKIGLFKIMSISRTQYQNKEDEYWIHFVLKK